MDDRFQIASSIEGNKVNGASQVAVSGIAPPARVGSGQCCVCICHGKNESGDCLPEVALPLPPHPPLQSRFCEEEVGLVPRHPSPPPPDCKLIV